jgi:hypothetical protein
MDGDIRGSLAQLSGKRRTYEDLSRFVGARASGTANYSLLLGAGCSVSSNVRSASQLIDQWRQEVFSRLRPGEQYSNEVAIDYLTKNQAVWYNPQREYSSLFEKNFDLPRQRRMFVEHEVAGKNPNLGYAYLVRLIEEGYLNTVFTTNFDDLVNEAFFQFSQTRPIVCAHDSSIGSIAVTSKRPKVIKLHGDYLFDDIKATVRETESLEDNTRRKFIEFCRDFGLIVVGYGGYDRSIMDVLQYLLRSEDYFKHGIYWCLRKGDQPSDELLKLLWRDRVYFVEIDGFDELMASLHNDLVGKTLPIDSGVVTNKPKTIIKGFCENSFLLDSPSEIIKRDLERLRRQSEREELFSVLRDAKDETADREKQSVESLSERELAIVFEIKQSLGNGDFDVARGRIGVELELKPSKKLKEELSELRVRVEELAGDLAAAVAAVDSLILEDPQEPENYIRKTFLITDHPERIRILDAAQEIDGDNFRVYGRKVDCYIDAYDAGTVGERQDLYRQIEENIARSLALEPSLRNPTWRTATDFFADCSLSKDEVRAKLDGLIERCNALGSRRTVTLRARLRRWSKYKEDRNSPAADELLKDISAARLASSKSLQPFYEWLELDAYKQLGRKEDLSRRLSELALNPDLADTREYLRRKSDFLIKFNGDIHAAVGALKQAVKADPSRSDILRLSSLMENVGDAAGIAELAATHAVRLHLIDRIILKREECAARGDHEAALAQLRSTYSKKLVGAAEKLAEIHDLLLLTRYGEAASIGKGLLERLGWNKLEFGEHIINFELAQVRMGEAVNKKRLGELADLTRSEQVKGCAQYLLGDTTKARDTLTMVMREDREDRYTIPRWAIFQDDKGKTFIDTVVKAAV